MKGYNGYTNWATWNIMLWASNDEGIYKQISEFVKWFSGRIAFEKKVYCLFMDLFPYGTPDMEFGDMKDVDWKQVTKHLTEWND